MLAWIRRRLAADDGISLPELLVSITIMTVVSAGVVASVVAVNRSLGTANATMVDMQNTRNAIDRIGQLLRGAVAVDGDLTRSDTALLAFGNSPSETDIAFYSMTGINTLADQLGDPSLACTTECNPIAYRLFLNNDNELVEQRVNPNPVLAEDGPPNYDLSTVTSRVIARDVQTVDAAGNPVSIFRYWSHYWDRDDNFDNVVDQPVSDRCGREVLPSGGVIPASDRDEVDSVSFTIVIRDTSSAYDNAPVELRGWARFAAAEDLGFSASFDSAGCLDEAGGGFGYGS